MSFSFNHLTNHYRIIILLITNLIFRYSEMFKPTSRCRAPHVNIDELRNDLFQSDLMVRGKLNSSQDLLKYLEGINSKVGEKLLVEEKALDTDGNSSMLTSKSMLTAFQKAKKFQFYLGMDKSWMYM